MIGGDDDLVITLTGVNNGNCWFESEVIIPEAIESAVVYTPEVLEVDSAYSSTKYTVPSDGFFTVTSANI